MIFYLIKVSLLNIQGVRYNQSLLLLLLLIKFGCVTGDKIAEIEFYRIAQNVVKAVADFIEFI